MRGIVESWGYDFGAYLPRRCPQVSIHGRTCPGDRTSLARHVGRRWNLRDSEPVRAARGSRAIAGRQKLFVLDMFPYPSGTGLHVGHPLGFIGTDIYSRYKRMTGFNVMYTMGFDAFGLPAEQYAVQTGQHPAITTNANVANYRRQLRRLGLSHDGRRSISTTDPGYYRWTQWIFLQIFNSWYDTEEGRARPIGELVEQYRSGDRRPDDGRAWSDLSPADRNAIIDSHRLAYVSDAPVNWCPGLGTVVANEEVTVRWSQRPRQLPCVQAQHASVDDAHHCLCRPAHRRSRPARLDGCDQGDATQLDRAQRRRDGALPVVCRPDHGVHDPSRHAVRSDVHGARPRAPACRRV